MDDPLLFSFFAYLPFFSLFSRTGYGQRVDNGRGHWATPTSRPLRSWTATLLGWRAGWSCDIVQFVPFRNVLQQTQSIFSPHQEGSTTMSGNVNSTMARLQLAKRGAGRSARTVSQLHESQSYRSQSCQQRCRRSQTPPPRPRGSSGLGRQLKSYVLILIKPVHGSPFWRVWQNFPDLARVYSIAGLDWPL